MRDIDSSKSGLSEIWTITTDIIEYIRVFGC
jgi:hypothetical protein